MACPLRPAPFAEKVARARVARRSETPAKSSFSKQRPPASRRRARASGRRVWSAPGTAGATLIIVIKFAEGLRRGEA
ncbi:MAG TPA: hypothetical protein DDZ68_07390 [Parvularcula sp.]|nr:hypothetical protein [Parvularcula sp.]HBS33430.1 hypothetical protein [Parvularcula sp.]